MVLGTSLTFYRGFEAHAKLLQRLRRIGLPVATMSSAVVDGLRALGAKKIGVSTNAKDAQGMLISCGGLKTLPVGKTIEDQYGLPVVSSTPAAFWSAMRLVGESGKLSGYGRLFETVHKRAVNGKPENTLSDLAQSDQSISAGYRYFIQASIKLVFFTDPRCMNSCIQASLRGCPLRQPRSAKRKSR